MRFSEAFSIKTSGNEDWFDPDLSVDTKLFLDPFLMLQGGQRWERAHRQLIDHFTYCYELVARAKGKQSLSAKSARVLLTFPEPYEFCLGYTAASIRGSGSGKRSAEKIMDGIAVALSAGLKEPENIEEIGIINEGFGADAISDATLNILKNEFISYTQKIVADLGIPVKSHSIRNASVHLEPAHWQKAPVELPTNPSTGAPILLVPKIFLNDLPTLNARSWFESDINEELRTSLNLEISKSAPKSTIVDLARKNPDAVQKWARAQRSRPDLFGYNFEDDPCGVVSYDHGSDYATKHPLSREILVAPASQKELSNLIREMLTKYKHFIEQGGGWRLLWNADGKPKPEEAAQLLFMAMSRTYLRDAGVELDREVQLGRGPVDFKVSSGAKLRLLIEVKKVENARFWNGLQNQLPSYMESDQTNEGWLVAIQYRETKSSTEKVALLPGQVSKIASENKKTLHYISINACPPLSASKI